MTKRGFFSTFLSLIVILAFAASGWMQALAAGDPIFTVSGGVFQGQVGDTSSPIGGVTVRLYGSASADPAAPGRTLVATDVTGDDGSYSLAAQDGEQGYAYYFVIEQNLAEHVSVGATSPSGEVVTADILRFATPAPGAALVENYFFDDLFYFSGNVYEGEVGDTSTPIPGVTVELYGSATPYPSTATTLLAATVTDASGFYILPYSEDVFAYYFVIEQNLPGYTSVGATSEDGIVVTPDVIQFTNPLIICDSMHNNFWDERPAGPFTFSGSVYEGALGVTTTPIPGVTVSLLGSATPYPSAATTLLGSAVTDAAGAYAIQLAADTYAYYFVQETTPAGYTSVGAQSAAGLVVSVDDIQFAAPLAGQDLTANNFWDERPTGEQFVFSGNVYQGDLGNTTTPLAGVTVSLYGGVSTYPANPKTLLATAVTDASGAYTLPLAADTFAFYFIVEQNLPGYVSVGATTPGGAVRTPDEIEFAAPLAGQNLTLNNFWDAITENDYVFTGSVYLGQVFDITQPIGGVPVFLYGSNTPYPDPGTLITQTITELDGSFSLPLGADTYAYYFITEQTPLGYFDAGAITIDGTVMNSGLIQFTAPLAGQFLNGNIFWDDISICLTAFTGRVYSGQLNDVTTPLEGVVINLYGSLEPYPSATQVLIGSEVTDTVGAFRIPILADDYPYYFLIQQNLPGYTSVGVRVNSGFVVNPDVVQYTTPLVGKNLSAIRFWDVPSTSADSITGQVYQGDASDPLPGVLVSLYGADGAYVPGQSALLDSDVTNAQGEYSLTAEGDLFNNYYLVRPGLPYATSVSFDSLVGGQSDPYVTQLTGPFPGSQQLEVDLPYPKVYKVYLPFGGR
jgi:hypothetical protein